MMTDEELRMFPSEQKYVSEQSSKHVEALTCLENVKASNWLALK